MGFFRELIKGLQDLGEREPFDASRFGDPLAETVDWTLARVGGTNFRTHRLVEVDSDRIVFRATLGAIVFGSVFLLVGLGIGICLPVAALSNGGSISDPGLWGGFLFGMVFGGVRRWPLRVVHEADRVRQAIRVLLEGAHRAE